MPIAGRTLLCALVLLPAASPAADSSPRAVDEAVEEVFSDPAFRRGLAATSGGFPDLVAWLWREAIGLYVRLIRALQDLELRSPLLFWAIVAFLVLLLFLILFHIGWMLSLAFRGHAAGEVGGAPAGAAVRALRFRELRAEAGRLAQAGRLREAARRLLLAVLELLEEKRVLRLARGWTNREILERLRFRLRGALDAELERFGAVMEAACYGDGEVSPEDFQSFDALLDRLLAQVDRGLEAREPPAGWRLGVEPS
jgi:hypothetical protein